MGDGCAEGAGRGPLGIDATGGHEGQQFVGGGHGLALIGAHADETL